MHYGIIFVAGKFRLVQQYDRKNNHINGDLREFCVKVNNKLPFKQ